MSELSHPWNLDPAAAVALQKDLRSRVLLHPLATPPKFIAGADLSYEIGSDVLYAGIIVFTFPDFQPVEVSLIKGEATFPYTPGLLSFREIPHLVRAWQALTTPPDLLVMDGHGIAHPRKFGVASHFGVLMDVPTIGCAKKHLNGHFDPPAASAHSTSPLLTKPNGEQIGWVYRTQEGIKPVWVSPGHKIDMESTREIMAQCVGTYRIPIPTRWADIWVNKIRRGDAEVGVHPISSLPPM